MTKLPWLLGALLLLVGALIIWLTATFTRGVSYGLDLSPAAGLPANRYGVNVELDKIVTQDDLQRSVQLITAAGFGFVRQVFAWSEIEINGKGDFYDAKNGKSAWDKYDRLVDAGSAAGLQFIARLERPPAWSRASGSAETAPPTDLDDYGDFVAAFLQHFKGRVHYVQVWNEPNRFEDWGYQPVDPVAYTRMLQIAYARAKQVDPSVVVLSAALTPTTDCCQKNRPDPLYLQQMYDAGARGSFDVLGAQAYGLRAGPEDPWQDLPLRPNDARKAVIDSHNTNFGRVVLDRQVMVRNGDAGKPVWVCEFGWNALPVGWTGDASPWGSVSLQQQAAYTVQAYQRAQREWPWLGVMNLWLFQDPSPAPNDPTQFFGLVDQQFQPRPVYVAIQSLVHQRALAETGEYAASGPAAAYQGAWQALVEPSTVGPGEGEVRPPAARQASPTSGSTVTFHFHGSAVALRTRRGPNMGIAYATVDDSPTYATEVSKDSAGRAAIDLYAPEAGPSSVSITSGLLDGEHRLTIVVSGLQDPRSSGPAVEVDGFSVGLTRDQRPYYAGGLLAAMGGLVLGWNLLALLARRIGLCHSGRSEAAVPWMRMLRFAQRGQRRPERFLLCLIPVSIPFYLQPIHFRGVEFPLSELLLGSSLAIYLLRTAAEGHWRWPRSAYTWPALAFLLAATASVGAAEFPRYALREWRTDIFEPLVLFTLIILIRPRVKLLLDLLLIGGLIVALAGVLQYARQQGIQAEGVLRMVGVYRSPDNFALYLGRLVPIAAAIALLAPLRLRWRAIYAAGAALGLIGVVLSFTRGAWLGDVAALLIVGAFAGRRWLAAGIVGGAVTVAAITTVQAKRIQSAFDLTPGSTGFTRLELWRSAVRMIAAHPILGVGLDNFLYQYPRYIMPEARNEPDLSHPHNLLLDFWTRIGVFGLAALVWLVVVFLRQAARVIKSASGFERAAGIGLVASMVDCLVHGLVDNSYFLIDLSLVFWLTLGLMQLLEWGTPRQEEMAT